VLGSGGVLAAGIQILNRRGVDDMGLGAGRFLPRMNTTKTHDMASSSREYTVRAHTSMA